MASSAKPPAVSRQFLILCALIATVGVAYYLNMGTPSKAAAAKPKKKTTASSNSLYTDEDYKAHFAMLTTPVKNVFKPLVVSGGGVNGAIDTKTGIPTYLTGGEADWTFTGTAEDGTTVMALVENRARGTSDFLKVGQAWKTSKVTGIDSDHLMLQGPDGDVKTILVEAEAQDRIAQAQANVSASNPVAPVAPPISGPIGGAPGGRPNGPNVGAAGIDSSSLSVQPDSTTRRRGNRPGGS